MQVTRTRTLRRLLIAMRSVAVAVERAEAVILVMALCTIIVEMVFPKAVEGEGMEINGQFYGKITYRSYTLPVLWVEMGQRY